MARTMRKTFRGETVRDGEWTRRCHSKNCEYCKDGAIKRQVRRKDRHETKTQLRKLTTI